MKPVRRVYAVWITVNGIRIHRLIIDPHYEIRHRSSMSDELILELVVQLDHQEFSPEAMDEEGYRYFSYDLELSNKPYRLIWLLPPTTDYLGVVNAYRRHHGRNS